MRMTRKDLKVGETYEHLLSLKVSKILFIGNEMVLTFDNNEQEKCYTIRVFLDYWNLVPKSKKQIKLIGYLTPNGFFHEVEGYRNAPVMGNDWRKVSERTIEVDDDKEN